MSKGQRSKVKGQGHDENKYGQKSLVSINQSINQSIIIFSVAQIVNYYWDHESVYGETIEC